MSDNDRREETEKTEPSYLYRWSYADQVAFEAGQEKKKRKRGAAVYAIVMVTVFLLCIALLVGTLVWYHAGNAQSVDRTALTTGEVAELVKPSTVLIYASGTASYGYGTGFIVTENGHIATNYHVVKGQTDILVTLYAGTEVKAKLVGYKEADDLAILKIEGNGYPTVAIGNSDTLQVGDKAIAIGNPSGTDASWTTTQGIISALNREVTVTGNGTIDELTMIQTDAPVNPGNSGGPLCNDRGEVIGIVTRKLSDYEGIGLAIPINGAMEILNAIIEKGNADDIQSSISKVRPAIGIKGGTIQKGKQFTVDSSGRQFVAKSDGVFVTDVIAGGAADGILKAGDIIVALDGTPVPNIETLTALLDRYRIGDRVELEIWRKDIKTSVTITFKNASN